MSSKLKQGEAGSSLLELSGVLLVVLPLLIGVTAVADYVLLTYRTGRILEQTLFDQHLKAFRMMPDGGVQLNQDALRGMLDNYASRAEASLREAFGSENMPPANYRLEIEVASVELDQNSAQTKRVLISPQLHESRGVLAIPPEMARQTELQGEFERLAGQVGSPSPLAIPLVQGVGPNARYFPAAALVGARVFVSFEFSPTARVLSTLGVVQNPISFDWKAVPIRGDVEAL